MANKKVRPRARKGRKAAETLCTGMIVQVAALGWSFAHMAEAMSADELRAHIRAIDHLGANAVSPDAVRYVRTILDRELGAREAGKLIRIPNPPGFDPETF